MFAILGFIVGVTFTVNGGATVDLIYHATLFPVLIVTALMLLLQWTLASPPIYLQQLLLAAVGFALQLMYPIVTLRVLDLFHPIREEYL